MTHLLAQSAAPALMHPLLAASAAAAVSVPILIHLLWRLRRRPVAFGAMRLLQRAFLQHRNRMRIEQWLLLLMRCLALLLLAVGLGRPILTGLAGLSGVAGDAGSRRLVLVIDDSLSSAALMADGRPRIHALLDQARALLASCEASDQVAVWLAGRPVRALEQGAWISPATAAEALASLEPTLTRSDLVEALRQIEAHLPAQSTAPPPTALVVVSDLSPDAIDLTQSIPEPWSALRQRVRWQWTRPLPAVENAQVAALRPGVPALLLRGPMSRSLPVEVEVERFGDISSAVTRRLRLGLEGQPGMEESVTWGAGQARVSLSLMMPLSPGAIAPESVMGLTASLEGGDALAVDDAVHEALGTLGVLRVVWVGSAEPEGRRWWLAAMGEATGSGVEVVPVDPQAVDAAMLAGASSVVVTQPSAVPESSWRLLAERVASGASLWVMPDEMPATWAVRMTEPLGLPWTVSLEPITLTPPRGLRTDGGVPAELSLLSSDWGALWSPVTVWRRLAISTPVGRDVWIALDDESSSAWLVGRRVGRGVVVLLASAVEVGWTTLPTKPVFVPLVHEVVRQSLRAHDTAHRVTVGEAVDPGVGATAVLRPGVTRRADGGVTVARLDPAGGDTGELPLAALEGYLSGSGGESPWLEGSPWGSEAAVASGLGWPFLLGALGVLLVETALARWFSHARRSTGPSVLSRALAQLGRASE